MTNYGEEHHTGYDHPQKSPQQQTQHAEVCTLDKERTNAYAKTFLYFEKRDHQAVTGPENEDAQ